MVQLLLVDDDKDILKFVKMLLETRGYAVTTCSDALEAVEMLQKQPFDVLLSDANMPGRSGFDLVKTVRSMDQYQDLAVALLSGRRERRDVEHAMDVGADEYIVKPVDPDVLFSKLDSLLKRRPPTLRPEVHFAESSVHSQLGITLVAEAEAISEMGMTFLSPSYFSVNSKLHFDNKVFSEIGVQAPITRVRKCEPIEKDGKELFRTHVTFVGLSEAELQKIRSWVHYNSIYGKNKGVA